MGELHGENKRLYLYKGKCFEYEGAIDSAEHYYMY